jgi:hypothetical protein
MNQNPTADVMIAWDFQILSSDQYARLVKILGDLVRLNGGAGIERIESIDVRLSRERGIHRQDA